MEGIKMYVEKNGVPFLVLRQQDISPSFSPTSSFHVDGWEAQQIAKLRVASFVTSDYYVILDSKNIATRPLQLSDFQSQLPFNYVEIPLSKVKQPHRKWYERTYKTLRMDWESAQEDLVPLSVTPVVFHTEAVKQMILDVERETGMSFEFIVKRQFVSEFCFYNAYLRREGLLEKLHSLKTSGHDLVSRVLWDATTDTAHIIDFQVKQPCLFFGLHRRWAQHLSKEEKNAFILQINEVLGVTPNMTWIRPSCYR